MPSAKCCPFCLSLNVLRDLAVFTVLQELISAVNLNMVISASVITEFGLTKKNIMPYSVEPMIY